MPLTFITGPVRSGKSRFALRLANETGLRVTFLATAAHYDGDAEWTERLSRHRAERPAEWTTVEGASLDQAELLAFVEGRAPDEALVVDAVGTYVAARIDEHLRIAGDGPSLQESVERDAIAFARALVSCPAHVIVVGEQVGWDVVPERPSARMFRDILGRVQRRLALEADAAYLVVTGYALDLRQLGLPID